jgi:hypothetical protein
MEAVSAARVSAQLSRLSVTYESPYTGTLEFGWKGAFRVNGTAMPLSDYPRYDCPYARIPFPPGDRPMEIALGGKRILLDFAEGRVQ